MEEKDIRQKIGSKIKELRTEKTLTTRELASQAGVTQANLIRTEQGKNNIGIVTLEKILNKLDASLEITQ